MIVLRSDGDDQPRDEQGQFASTGGVSLRSPGTIKAELKEAKSKAKMYNQMGLGNAKKYEARAAELEKELASTKPELKTPAKGPKAPTAGEHVEAVKTLRSKFPVDTSPSGFAQASTAEIAKAIGVEPKRALSLLQKAAREGLVTRRGHEGTVKSGKVESASKGFGYQIWEVGNATKLP